MPRALALLTLLVLASCARPSELAPPAEVGVIRIPIHLEGGMPWVDAEIDGRTVRLLLDLGGFDSVALIPRELEEIQVTWTGRSRTTFSAMGESARAREYMLKDFRLGGIVFPEVRGYEDLLHGKQRAVARSGYLGLGILRRFRVVIDYPARQLVLIWPDVATPSDFDIERWPTASLTSSSEGVMARVNLDGVDRLMVWDTGASHCVLKSGLEGSAPVRELSGHPFASTKSLLIADHDFGPTDFALLDFKQPKADGFIGYSFFAKHAVYVDFEKRILAIKPD
jgi:predicted aspartyl protease